MTITSNKTSSMTMPSLTIYDADIPRLDGEVAIITGEFLSRFSSKVNVAHFIILFTGGASGIGLAAVRILAAKGAEVFVLDLTEPDINTIPSPSEGEPVLPEKARFIQCDVTSWADLRKAFDKTVYEAGRIDIAISNAGVSEEHDYFTDQFDESGNLLEPEFEVIDVNFCAVVSFVKLAVSQMRKQRKAGDKKTGRIVVTSSATAYAPEHNLPVYSASKLATIGLMRGLRSALIMDDITINAVAPAATITKLLPQVLAKPLMAAGLPVSSAEFVGRALVYSATAQQNKRVEDYGKDAPTTDGKGSWNGRTILTLGDRYTEVEEPHAELRRYWLGWENTTLTRAQQAATDFRKF
ncbi:hypothetical protein NW752_004185 [Fusarium irregulare]|nr:hypothetical protein NW752_004185 [Fusarium irregulare]